MYAGLASPVMKHINEFHPVPLVNSVNRKEAGFLYGDRMGTTMTKTMKVVMDRNAAVVEE